MGPSSIFSRVASVWKGPQSCNTIGVLWENGPRLCLGDGLKQGGAGRIQTPAPTLCSGSSRSGSLRSGGGCGGDTSFSSALKMDTLFAPRFWSPWIDTGRSYGRTVPPPSSDNIQKHHVNTLLNTVHTCRLSQISGKEA